MEGREGGDHSQRHGKPDDSVGGGVRGRPPPDRRGGQGADHFKPAEHDLRRQATDRPALLGPDRAERPEALALQAHCRQERQADYRGHIYGKDTAVHMWWVQRERFER